MGAIYAAILLIYLALTTQTSIYERFISFTLQYDALLYETMCTLVGTIISFLNALFRSFTGPNEREISSAYEEGVKCLSSLGIVESSFHKFVAGPVMLFSCLMIAFHTYGAIQQYLDTHPGPWTKYKRHRSDILTYWDMLPVVLTNQAQLLLVMLVGHAR